MLLKNKRFCILGIKCLKDETKEAKDLRAFYAYKGLLWPQFYLQD
jgi:hypothetical protein